MKYWVNVQDTFDAAHFLPGHRGKCSSLHGHRYTVEVGVSHPPEAIVVTQGFAFDMGVLKEALRKITTQFDHKCLNTEGFTVPSAENIARRILEALQGEYVHLRVRVWETPDSYVEVVEE